MAERRKKVIAEEYERRKQAEKEAHAIVEILLEGSIAKDLFLISLKKISSQHYDDIVEERSLSNNCGYCLCQNKVKEVPPQQYKISKNRVCDITERKKYCSNQCFALSCKIREQIPSAPLWLRNVDDMPDIGIPEESSIMSGSAGEQIHLRHAVSEQEVEMVYCEEKSSGDLATHSTKPASIVKSSATKFPRVVNTNKPKSLRKVGNMADEVLSVLRDWITPATKEFLGLTVTKEPSTDVAQIADEASPKEILLERQLNRLILDKECRAEHSTPKPMPDYKTLHDGAKKFEDKVSSFYGSTLQIKERLCQESAEDDSHDDNGSTNHALPTVDFKNQMIIRQKIVMDRVRNVLDGLSPPLPNISQDLRQFMKSLRLSSKNVMLSTDIWPVLTVSLLNLLGTRNQRLQESLNSEDVAYLIEILLKPYHLKTGHITSMVLEIFEGKKVAHTH